MYILSSQNRVRIVVWTFHEEQDKFELLYVTCNELDKNKLLDKINFLAGICEQRWKLSYARVISYIMDWNYPLSKYESKCQIIKQCTRNS
jgi:hypothetical protein